MGMTNFEGATPSYASLLDDAEERIAQMIGLTHRMRVDLKLRDIIRTIYCAASNAQAICEDQDFARDIFLVCCGQGQVTLIRRLAADGGAIDLALKMHLADFNPFVEVIGDLFNE